MIMYTRTPLLRDQTCYEKVQTHGNQCSLQRGQMFKMEVHYIFNNELLGTTFNIFIIKSAKHNILTKE